MDLQVAAVVLVWNLLGKLQYHWVWRQQLSIREAYHQCMLFLNTISFGNYWLPWLVMSLVFCAPHSGLCRPQLALNDPNCYCIHFPHKVVSFVLFRAENSLYLWEKSFPSQWFGPLSPRLLISMLWGSYSPFYLPVEGRQKLQRFDGRDQSGQKLCRDTIRFCTLC